jgi:hypothetical protein
MLSRPSFSSPLINEDLPAGPHLVFTLTNRFFRHQACYSLLPAKPGGQADSVVRLCKYKVVGTCIVVWTEGKNKQKQKLTTMDQITYITFISWQSYFLIFTVQNRDGNKIFSVYTFYFPYVLYTDCNPKNFETSAKA